jgi:protein-S-isoprenylcysteine O-methyltransferase Ste14
MRLLHTLGWLACAVYSSIPSFWLLIHTRADYWRSRRTSPYRVLIPLWTAMWVMMAVITSPWRHLQLYDRNWSWIPAIALFAAGLWLYVKSSASFSAKQLGGLPELRSNHPETRLVTTGIRSRVRHPVYLAHLCEMLAWSVGTGLAVCYGLTAFAVLAGMVMIKKEDWELERRFGAEFLKYKRLTPALIPSPSKNGQKSQLTVDGDLVQYTVNGELAWAVRLSEIVCLAEYTTAEGPWRDDYFLLFMTRANSYYLASFYSDGCGAILEQMGLRWGSKLQLKLVNKTEFASSVIWPPHFQTEEFFVEIGQLTVNPRIAQLLSARNST